MLRGVASGALFIALATVACRPSEPVAPSQPEVAPSQPDAMSPTELDGAPTPVASTEPETADAQPDAAAETPEAAPAVAEPEVPPACSGAALDLDALLATKDCDVDDAAALAPPPDRLQLSIDPAEVVVERGRRGEARVVMSNVGADPLVLDLPMNCGKEVVFAAGLYRGTERADRIEVCGTGRGCGRRTLRVRIDPGGTLSTRIGFEATVQHQKQNCELTPRKPIARGTYDLRVSTPLRDRGKCSNCVVPREAVGKVRVR